MRKGTRRLYVEIGGQCVDCGIRGATRSTIAGYYQPDIRAHKYYRFKLSAGCSGCGGTGVNSKEIVNLHGFASKTLLPKELFVLGLRYGFKDGNIYSQWEIAKLMDVHQSTVSRIERAAVDKVRRKAYLVLAPERERLFV